MKLQIEEDLASTCDQVAHELRSFGSEQLLANFEDLGGISNLMNDPLSLSGGGDIKRDNQMTAWIKGHVLSLNAAGGSAPSINKPERAALWEADPLS